MFPLLLSGVLPVRAATRYRLQYESWQRYEPPRIARAATPVRRRRPTTPTRCRRCCRGRGRSARARRPAPCPPSRPPWSSPEGTRPARCCTAPARRARVRRPRGSAPGPARRGPSTPIPLPSAAACPPTRRTPPRRTRPHAPPDARPRPWSRARTARARTHPRGPPPRGARWGRGGEHGLRCEQAREHVRPAEPLGDRPVPGGLHERGELGVGHRPFVDVERCDADLAHRPLTVVGVGGLVLVAHAEGPAGQQDHALPGDRGGGDRRAGRRRGEDTECVGRLARGGATGPDLG